MVRDRSSSYKIVYIIVIKNFLNPKEHQNPISGSKSYGHFTEGVEFAYCWSCIGKGLRLQPAQQACFLMVYNSFKLNKSWHIEERDQPVRISQNCPNCLKLVIWSKISKTRSNWLKDIYEEKNRTKQITKSIFVKSNNYFFSSFFSQNRSKSDKTCLKASQDK